MGYAGTLSPITKYVFQYLFVQSEFGQMCPISVTDTSIHLIRSSAARPSRSGCCLACWPTICRISGKARSS